MLLTLDMIARSDARGLERAIASARPHVDLVQVGVDARSDRETLQVARRFADHVWQFNAADIGLSPEEWAADRIHFANARNIGRRQVKTPWVLVLDTDEYLQSPVDLREIIRRAPPEITAFAPTVHVGEAASEDVQRLARAEFLWTAHTHNQLAIEGEFGPLPDVHIYQVLDLRPEREIARRTAQRDAAMEALVADAEAGNMAALYHVAKHKAHEGDAATAAAWVERYRRVTEVHGPVADDRAHLAVVVACAYMDAQDWANAERWAVRALLDGPRLEAFCVLGDVAETRKDLAAALTWYEIACTVDPPHGTTVTKLHDYRFTRRDELRQWLSR